MSSPEDSAAERRRWVRTAFNGHDDGHCADAHVFHAAQRDLQKASGAHEKQQREHADGGGPALKLDQSDTTQNLHVKKERKGAGAAMDRLIKNNYDYAFNTKENTSVNTTFYALHPNGKEHVLMSASPMGKYSKRAPANDDTRQESRLMQMLERSHHLRGEDVRDDRAPHAKDTKKDAFAQDMHARVYSKGILLKVFTDLFPDGVSDPATLIDGEKRVEMRGRRDLPRSMRRANLVVFEKKKVTSDNVAAAATSSVAPNDTAQERLETKTAPQGEDVAAHIAHHNLHQHADGKGEATPWQWPAEWAESATLNREAGGRAAKPRTKPPKPVRLELAAAVETEGRNELQHPSTPPGQWPFGFSPQVIAAMPMLHPTLQQALHGHNVPPSMAFGPHGTPPHGYPPHGRPPSAAGGNPSPMQALGLSTPSMSAPWIPSAIPPLLPPPWDRRVPDSTELSAQVPPLSRPWDKKRSVHSARASSKEPIVDFTTVMLRHIPNKYTRQMLLDKLDEAGFSGLYDFVYLPCDFANGCNVGYAFINFNNRAATQKFIDTFHHVKTKECLGGFNSTKVCEVMPARVQGKEANLLNIQHSPIALEHLKDNPEWKPVVYGSSSVDENLKLLKKRASERHSRTDEANTRKMSMERKTTTSGTSHFSREDLFAKEYEAIPVSLSALGIQTRGGQSPLNFTTVMLRNIPNKYTRQMLCERLNDNFHKEFDFLYLPIDFVNKCNVGYAFINFRTTESTARFIKMFHHVECRVCLKGFNSVKVCEVTAARLQGREANIEHLKHSTVIEQIQARPEWQPLVFDDDGNAIEQIFKPQKKKPTKPSIAATSVPSVTPAARPPPPPTPPPVAVLNNDNSALPPPPSTPAGDISINMATPRDSPQPVTEEAAFGVSNASLRAEAPAFIPTAAEVLPRPSRLAPPHLQSDLLRAEAPAFIPTLTSTPASTAKLSLTSASIGIPSPQRTPLFSTTPSAYGNVPPPLLRSPLGGAHPVKKPAQVSPLNTSSPIFRPHGVSYQYSDSLSGALFRPHVVGTPIGGSSKGKRSYAVDGTVKGKSSSGDAPGRGAVKVEDVSVSVEKEKCPSDDVAAQDITNGESGEPKMHHDQAVTGTKTHSTEKKAPAQHDGEEHAEAPDVNAPSTSSLMSESGKINVSGAGQETMNAAELGAVAEEGDAAERAMDKQVDKNEGAEKKTVEQAKPSWMMTISNIFTIGMFRGVDQFQKRKTDGDAGPPT